jgi:hypothetical protein
MHSLLSTKQTPTPETDAICNHNMHNNHNHWEAGCLFTVTNLQFPHLNNLYMSIIQNNYFCSRNLCTYQSMHKFKLWAPKKLSIITCFITNFVCDFVTTTINVHHVKYGINILLGNVHTIYISTSFTSWELLMSRGSCIYRMICLGQWLFYP